MAATKTATGLPDAHVLPHREANTSVVESVKVPSARRVLFLAVDNNMLSDDVSGELAFCALSQYDRAAFQLLIYLTYCCKGEILQVTLENPDFYRMSPPIREDFAHGRLFCFILNMSSEDTTNAPSSRGGSQSAQGNLDATDEYVSGNQLLGLINMNVDMNVFREEDVYNGSSQEADSAEVKETLDEALNAFMRLQLVRKGASSLNNAMIVMRDGKGDLGSLFDWVDICSDSLNSNQVDKKTVKELQGSMYTPTFQPGRKATVLPEPIATLNVRVLENSIGRLTDSASTGEGKALFLSTMSKLTGTQWMKHKVMHAYNATMREDTQFLKRLKVFTGDLSGSSDSVDIRGLLVFRYSMEKLIDRESPDTFVKSLIHRHVPVPKNRMDKVLRDIRSKRRTRALASLLNNGRCYCRRRRATEGGVACSGECQTAYSCFYNLSEHHPFIVSKDDLSYYFARLYPHLGKLERLGKEMKVKHKGSGQFECIAEMVFNILIKHRFCANDSLYEGLSDLMDGNVGNSSLSLGHNLAEIHEGLWLAPGDRAETPDGPGSLHPLKVYDHALVRYLFCDSLQVGRLFQVSTTFNYIIVNTAPRYTIERIMLFNVTGPGEGKSYANNVLNYLFRRVRGCIETLTSFTPQAFKYKEKRNACVVMIDDAHITHEKNVKAVDRESNVIPNTFKNLLDTSVLESDVVTRDMASGKVDTVKYQAVHNCGFVWNTNTLGFVSSAWADRCLIMESEFPEQVSRTRSTVQIQNTVEKRKMERVAAVCLYRQNLIQSATMIADSDIMQFSVRFDSAREACVAALHASHIVCAGAVSRRASFCINQLVFAEALKLACYFVFDIWIPPWTDVPDWKEFPDLRGYMQQMNTNRLKALNDLSFGQICLETNAVYKLCTAACLPDICPRVVDIQARFACKVLGYILTQIREQHLKTSLKGGHLCISGIDVMTFPETEIRGGNPVAHEMLVLCSMCTVPARETNRLAKRTYKLCTHRFSPNQNAQGARRGHTNLSKRVRSVTVPHEAVYDMLALYSPGSHSGFWDQLRVAMVGAYENGDFEDVNAFGQWANDDDVGDDEHPPVATLTFTLDFNSDPVRSVILEATAAVEPLNELKFNKSVMGGEVFQCCVPLYYGGVIRRAMSQNAPREAHDKRHQRESRLGPRGSFHGPRLSVYSTEYSGLPVKNTSSFCTTRTVYHQDKILLRNNGRHRGPVELEEDWEWKDAVEVFAKVHGADVFSVETLKRDYAVTMTDVKGEPITARPRESRKLRTLIRTLREFNGHAALAMRNRAVPGSEMPEPISHGRPRKECPLPSRTENKRARQGADSAEAPRVKRRKRTGLVHDI